MTSPSFPPKIKDFSEIETVVEKIWNLEITDYKLMDSLDDANFRIRFKSPNGLECATLKVVNAVYTKEGDILRSIIKVMNHLRKQGIVCPKPIGIDAYLGTFSFGEHFVRLQTYIAGTPFSGIAERVNGELYRDIGRTLAQMHSALRGIEEIKPLKRDIGFWNLRNLPKLRNDLDEFDAFRSLVFEKVIDDFEAEVLTRLNELPDQLIHGDLNDENVVVEKLESGVELNDGIDIENEDENGIVDKDNVEKTENGVIINGDIDIENGAKISDAVKDNGEKDGNYVEINGDGDNINKGAENSFFVKDNVKTVGDVEINGLNIQHGAKNGNAVKNDVEIIRNNNKNGAKNSSVLKDNVEKNDDKSNDSLPVYIIKGVLDLGDMHYSKCIFDIAICIAYMSLHGHGSGVDIIKIGGHVIAGYLENGDISELGIYLLKYCIQGRYVASLIANGNTTPKHLLWEALDVYLNTKNEDIQKIWKLVS